MRNEKVEVDLPKAYRLLHPRQVILVSCSDNHGNANIITLAWSMPISIRPPLVAIGIAPKRHSHTLLRETREFVINVPTMEIIEETLFCGRRSGREYDKFEEAGLTPLPAKMVKPPIIKECIGHLECKLHQQMSTGDHTLFIGQVVAAYVNGGVFNGKLDLGKVDPVYHIGEDDFVTVTSEIVTPVCRRWRGA